MLSGGQLENIGVTYIMDLLEPCSPYGAELVRRPHFYAPNEHEELIRELGRVRTLTRALQENASAFVQTERALMQLKDVRRSLKTCVELSGGGVQNGFKFVEAYEFIENVENAERPEVINNILSAEKAECEEIYESAEKSDRANNAGSAEKKEGRWGYPYTGLTAGSPALSDVELFELKRFLIRLESLVTSYRELCPNGLEGLEINAFTEALDIIDPDGMRAIAFRISDTCSAKIASVRAERKRVDLAIRTARPGEADALIAERTALTAEEDAEEARLRAVMTRKLGKYASGLLKTAEGVAKLDLAMAKARLLLKENGIIPTVDANGEELIFTGMVNPQVARALHEKGRDFTPVDIRLGPGSAVITGANMGGKSVSLKALALNAYLALCGFPVFCREARLPHYSDIHMLCEDMEDSAGGLSSFGGEMVRFDRILVACAEGGISLVLLDEFARGTNPHEGAALVRAAVRYFNANPHTSALITTHFDDVAGLARAHYQVMGLRNANRAELVAALSGRGDVKVRALEKYMDYGLYPASAEVNPPRDALTICRALGVSEAFMRLVDTQL